jgi:hypothetical protein
MGLEAGGKRLPARLYRNGDGHCADERVQEGDDFDEEDSGVFIDEEAAHVSLGIFRNISKSSRASKYGSVAKSSERAFGSLLTVASRSS